MIPTVSRWSCTRYSYRFVNGEYRVALTERMLVGIMFYKEVAPMGQKQPEF